MPSHFRFNDLWLPTFCYFNLLFVMGMSFLMYAFFLRNTTGVYNEALVYLCVEKTSGWLEGEQISIVYRVKLIWCIFVHASLYMHREENQLVATEWFIALVISSTCFGHLYAHHQELETILVLLPHMVRNALFAGGRRSGAGQQALRTICGNNTSIASSTWWWAYECPNHVEQITSAINHSVASSWVFFSTHIQWS